MNNKKYITTTLPYINGKPHIGHCYEFVLADIIAGYYRNKLGAENVFLNVGIDEHGQKVYDKSLESGFETTQGYCDHLSAIWKIFCGRFDIKYNNFYRTTSPKHKENVLRFFKQIEKDIHQDTYTGHYCTGCEAFITSKEIVDGKCPIHHIELEETSETNLFFDLNKYSPIISDVLIDKSLSEELKNIIAEDFKLSITRKNVKWGIDAGNGDVFYVWADALTNYIFALGYFEDEKNFTSFWENSLQICGKDNLKFQAYIFQALLLAGGIPQTKEILVHGLILDKDGNKLSKSLNNIIDPNEQKQKFGLSALRYYLFFGLNTFSNSKYSEDNLTALWNSDIVNGLGNLISRTLHLIDIKGVDVTFADLEYQSKIALNIKEVEFDFEKYDFSSVRLKLNAIISKLNKRFQDERPFEDKPESSIILRTYPFKHTFLPF